MPRRRLVTLPIIVNGRIDQPGDWDVFRFEGRAGDTVVAEVYARRLDSPLDSVLKLTDASGKQLAFNDDHEDKGAGLDTHYADSYLTATLPADGAFYIHIGDAQHQGGPEYAYRLRISPPQPDFALRVVPSSLSVRGGASVPLTVYALRRDGFTNEITLALRDAPAGFKLTGAKMPANQDQVRLTLHGPARAYGRTPPSFPGRPRVHPGPCGRPPRRPGRRHDAGLCLSASGSRQRTGGCRVRALYEPDAAEDPQCHAGKNSCRRHCPRSRRRTQQRLRGPVPAGAKRTAGGDQPRTECHPSARARKSSCAAMPPKSKPGLKGNLIVNIMQGQALAAAKKNKKQGNQQRAAVGTLPAIPFEVVPALKEN